ncbi:MAG: energy-coupling factor transporter transmembrane protein EcfT [Clostridia bacterium]|nr:energy-coupling factor transporter transmembrane protein EcfT [Clostridia bacterium]
MLKDITLGQFFPGKSFLHKIDPRTKIISALLYIVAVFLCDSIMSFIILLVATLILIAMSGVPIKIIVKGLKPLIFILAFTTIYNVFFYKGDTPPLVHWKFITIYAEGLVFAVIMALRIICLLAGSSVLMTYTTSPIMLTDGIERLLSPLNKIKAPVHEFAMMMSIALRFIPTLVEETDKIMSAQKARGADFNSGGLIKRARALIPVLVPLFISAFRRASDLAVAMECRCYRGGSGRTRMTKTRFGARDAFLFIAILLLGTAIVLSNIYSYYFPIWLT